MEYQLLALAMSERHPGTDSFRVIVMELTRYQLCPIRLKREEIINSDGRIVWDVGRITTSEQLTKANATDSDPRNVEYSAVNCRLTDEQITLKNLLEENLTDYREFQANQSTRFAIVKVDRVSRIFVEQKDATLRPQCWMTLFMNGESDKTTLLNKDCRWTNYWQWQFEQNNPELFERNSSRYLQLLNRNSKDLYLILYRHYFKKSAPIWIAGMHWL